MALNLAPTDPAQRETPAPLPPAWVSGPHAVTEAGDIDLETVRAALSTLSSAVETDFDR